MAINVIQMRSIRLHSINKGILLKSFLISALNMIFYCADAAPDPLTLIQGIESAREQIPPSRLLIKSITMVRNITNEHIHWVIFDKERRYYKRTNGPPVQTLFNGSEAIIYNGNSVIIRNLDSGTADHLYDPRLLGITTSYIWYETFQSALPYRKSSKIELIGQEKIEDKDAYHVRLIQPVRDQKRIIDLWIDAKNNFRVYRYEECSEPREMRNCGITRSFYEYDNYPYLPSRVETEDYVNGNLRFKTMTQIIYAEANVKIPETTWSLAGMEIPKNTPVSDVRISKLIGYWDGKRLIPQVDHKPLHPPVSISRVIILIVLVLLSVLPISLALVYYYRKKKPSN